MRDTRHPYSDARAAFLFSLHYCFAVAFLRVELSGTPFSCSITRRRFSRHFFVSVRPPPARSPTPLPSTFQPVMQHTMLIPTRVVHDDTLLIILRLPFAFCPLPWPTLILTAPCSSSAPCTRVHSRASVATHHESPHSNSLPKVGACSKCQWNGDL